MNIFFNVAKGSVVCFSVFAKENVFSPPDSELKVYLFAVCGVEEAPPYVQCQLLLFIHEENLIYSIKF